MKHKLLKDIPKYPAGTIFELINDLIGENEKDYPDYRHDPQSWIKGKERKIIIEGREYIQALAHYSGYISSDSIGYWGEWQTAFYYYNNHLPEWFELIEN